MGGFLTNVRLSLTSLPLLDVTASSMRNPLADIVLDAFQDGGSIVYILCGLSVAGVAVAFQSAGVLRKEKMISKDLLNEAENLWKEGKFHELEGKAGSRQCVMSRVLLAILKHRNMSFETVSQIASDVASSLIRQRLRVIYLLSVVATISPLLGLFGTILGMIEAFQRIAVTGAVGNPSIVADGISKALLTTAAGLFVGIPALAFYHYFKNRILQFACLIEENANVVLHDWLLANGRER